MGGKQTLSLSSIWDFSEMSSAAMLPRRFY
jgi:hypothetical protein